MIDIKEHHQRQQRFRESLEALVREKRAEARARFERELEEEKELESFDGNPVMEMIVDFTPAVDTVCVAWEIFKYIGVNHYLLFVDFDLTDNLANHRFTAEEFNSVFHELDPLAVEALLRKLKCSQREFENLISTWERKDNDAFVSTIKGLSCDLSGLAALCIRIRRIQQAGDSFSYDLRAFYSEYEPGVDLNRITYEPSIDLLDWLEKRVLSQSLNVPALREAMKSFMAEGKFYPFENEIIDSLINDPDVVAQFEKMKLLGSKHNRPSVEKRSEKASVKHGIVEVEEKYRYLVPKDVFDANKRIVDDKYYVQKLVKEVKEGENPVEHFQELFQFILQWGKVDNKAEQDAMLTLLTGYYIQGATSKARWCGDDYMPRVLYHIVKHISESRRKYAPLMYVEFYSNDPKKAVSINQDLETIRDGNISAKADETVPSGVRRKLWQLYPSIFLEPKE